MNTTSFGEYLYARYFIQKIDMWAVLYMSVIQNYP
jgi:hypothetical protein